MEPEELVGWQDDDSGVARAFGDRWFDERRSAVLVVPSATVRPYGRNVLLNPLHADFDRIQRETPAAVVWDPRLFR